MSGRVRGARQVLSVSGGGPNIHGSWAAKCSKGTAADDSTGEVRGLRSGLRIPGQLRIDQALVVG